MESYQDKITRKHSAHKRALIGLGGGKDAAPFTLNPSMKRGKSAPPIGESTLFEGGKPDWNKVLPLIKKEGLWATIEELENTIIIHLRKELVSIGRFKAEHQGFDQDNRPLYASHSNLNADFHGKFLGALGYFLIIEEVAKRNGTIAPFQVFQGLYLGKNNSWGTSDKAWLAWKRNLIPSGLLVPKEITRFRADNIYDFNSSSLKKKANKTSFVTYGYSKTGPQLFGNIVSSGIRSKDWTKKIARTILEIILAKTLRVQVGSLYYKINIRSNFPYHNEDNPTLQAMVYEKDGKSWKRIRSGVFLQDKEKLVELPAVQNVFKEIRKNESLLQNFFAQLWGSNWVYNAERLFYVVLEQYSDDNFKGTTL